MLPSFAKGMAWKQCKKESKKKFSLTLDNFKKFIKLSAKTTATIKWQLTMWKKQPVTIDLKKYYIDD